MRCQSKSHDQVPEISVLSQKDAIFRKRQREHLNIVSSGFHVGRPDDIQACIAK